MQFYILVFLKKTIKKVRYIGVWCVLCIFVTTKFYFCYFFHCRPCDNNACHIQSAFKASGFYTWRFTACSQNYCATGCLIKALPINCVTVLRVLKTYSFDLGIFGSKKHFLVSSYLLPGNRPLQLHLWNFVDVKVDVTLTFAGV